MATTYNDLYLDKPGDDTTVAAIKLRKPLSVSLMVGPPVDRESDGYYVSSFLAQPGKKVVCGGKNLKKDTDYVNLGDINRFTCGIGYRNKNFYADVAYQYQRQQGEVTPFQTQFNDGAMIAAYPSLNLSGAVNSMLSEKVDLNRHNVMLTLGYKF